MARLIGDIGSCHGKSLQSAIKCVSLCKDVCDCKFQLCRRTLGNDPIPGSWLESLVQEGRRIDVNVYVSVWDEIGLKYAIDAGCTDIKFAHSARHEFKLIESAYAAGLRLHITHDWLDELTQWPAHIPYWTVTCNGTPQYPVFHPITHDGPKRFAGFSYHGLGVEGILRAYPFYEYIEFHYNPLKMQGCADATFALQEPPYA